jgi:transposase
MEAGVALVMLRIGTEKDIEVLRQAALILDRENEKLLEKNLALQRENLRLRNESPEQLQQRIQALEEQLQRARQEIFGDSSEKRPGKAESTKPEKKPQTGHGPHEQKCLPLLETVHLLDEADRKNCAVCGGEMKPFDGQFEETEEIDVIVRQTVVRKHRRQKYVCACHATVETAPAPAKLIPGGRYSTGFAIEVTIDKYADHLPLERQVRRFLREGLVVDSNSLWDQVNALARVCEPVAESIRRYILAQPVVHADETHWKLLDGNKEREQKRWQAWGLVVPDAAHYSILPSRSGDEAEKILTIDGTLFGGVVVCDDYAAYDILKKPGGATLAHCWAHARRKFVDGENAIPPDKLEEILELIRQLYKVESTAPPGYSAEALALRLKLRQDRSKEIVEDIRKWRDAQACLPRSSFGLAISYLRNTWHGLTRFLDDPRIPLDNNPVERALRGPVLGRKNHYGSKSERGTVVAATVYTLLETAKLNDADPRLYLQSVVAAHLRGETALPPIRALNPGLSTEPPAIAAPTQLQT